VQTIAGQSLSPAKTGVIAPLPPLRVLYFAVATDYRRLCGCGRQYLAVRRAIEAEEIRLLWRWPVQARPRPPGAPARE
jgi:hypothetical protein